MKTLAQSNGAVKRDLLQIDVKSHAEQMLTHGLFPLPLKRIGDPLPNGKRANGKEIFKPRWQSREDQFHPDEFHFANLGIRLGLQPNGQMLIALDVDVDLPKDANGKVASDVSAFNDRNALLKPAAEWIAKHKEMLGDGVIESGRGYKVILQIIGPVSWDSKDTGVHKEIQAKFDWGNIKLYAGHKCQVVVPPSPHWSGAHNRWLFNDPQWQFKTITEADLRTMLACKHKQADSTPQTIQPQIAAAPPTDVAHKHLAAVIDVLKGVLQWRGFDSGWHKFDCPNVDEHSEATQGDLIVGINKHNQLHIHCFHSGASRHDTLTTGQWIELIEERYAVDVPTLHEIIYGNIPTREWIEKEVVGDVIWWAENGQGGRRHHWMKTEGDWKTLCAQSDKEQSRDIKWRLSKMLFKHFHIHRHINALNSALAGAKQSGGRAVAVPIATARRFKLCGADGISSGQTTIDVDVDEVAGALLDGEITATQRAHRSAFSWIDDITRRRRWVRSIRKSYCGAFAGYQKINDQPEVIMTSPKFIEGVKGDCKYTLDLLMSKMHDYGEPEPSVQYWSFLHLMLRQRLRFTERAHTRRCQAAFIIGAKDAGKTLTYKQIIERYLGGRSVEAWRTISDPDIRFNADVVGVEIAKSDDTIRGTSLEGRKAAEMWLRTLTGSGDIRAEQKYKDADTIHDFPGVFWGLLNDDDAVKGLPTMDENSMNKWHIFYFNDASLPDPERQPSNTMTAYDVRLHEEHSAFVWWMEHEMMEAAQSALGDEYTDHFHKQGAVQDETIRRFGMMAFQHSKGVDAFHESDPFHSLLEVVDELFVWGIDGTAQEIVKQIQDAIDAKRDEDGSRKSFNLQQLENKFKAVHKGNSRAIGKMLSRAASTNPSKVKRGNAPRGRTKWKIMPADDAVRINSSNVNE